MKTTACVIIFFLGATAASFGQTSDEQNMYRLAQSFEQAGDAEHAGVLYEQLEAAHPESYVYFEALRRNYTQRKKYDAAIGLCLRRLQSQPNDLNILTSLGGICSMAGRTAQADSIWDRVVASAPKNPGVYRLVAAEQIQQRLLDKAIATYRRGRASTGDKYGFANELASLYSAMMNYRGAADEYLLLLEQNEFQLDFVESRLSLFTSRPDGLAAALAAGQDYAGDPKRSVVFLRVLAWLWMEGKNYDKALGCAEQIEKRINSNGAELFVFAERAFREHAYGPAAQAYTLSIEHGAGMPFTAQAKLGRARCLEELSAVTDSTSATDEQRVRDQAVRLERVISAYEALASEYPLSEIHAQSLYRLGLLRASRLNDLNGALRAFDSITVIAPASPMLSSVRMSMGDVYLKLGKLDEARIQFAAVESSPQSTPQQQADAHFRIAELLYFKTDFDSALVMLEPLTANYQSDQANDALQLRAFILENKDGGIEGLRAFAQAEYLARRQKFSEAIAAFGAVILAYGSTPLCDDAMIRKAELEVQAGRSVDALRTLQALLSDLPKSTERDKAQFRIGEIYEQRLHDKENAVKAYNEILSAYPNSLYTEEARRRIRLLRGDSL
jgi:tetratricopeptide (TPR) repeat protein